MDNKKRGRPKKDLAEDSLDMLNKWELDDTDKKIIQHLHNYPNSTLAQIADSCGYSVGGIHKRLRRPVFKKALARLAEATGDILVRGQRRAAQRLIDLLEHPDPKICLEAAKLLLMPTLKGQPLKDSETEHIKEIIYQSQIGEQGQLFQEKQLIKADNKEPVKEKIDDSEEDLEDEA